jgi:hypothetical protein
MINDKIALIKSTPQYTEAISSPTKCAPLNITAAVENQIVQICFPENPFKDGVSTKVLVGDPIAVKALIKVVLYGKDSTTEAERNMKDYGTFDFFDDKKTPEASLLAIEEVLPSYPSADNFVLNYTNIFFDFIHLRLNNINEYIRDIDGIDNALLRNAARLVCSWFTTRSAADVRNVRDLIRACKVYDSYFCRNIKWLLTEMEFWQCNTVGTSNPSNTDMLFKESVVDPILARYTNKRVPVRVPVYKLIAEIAPAPEYIYSEAIFKYKLNRCGAGLGFCCCVK